MKKRFLTAALTGLLSAGMVMNTAAAPTGSEGGAIPYSEGTDVYAGVILDDPDAKLKVHVPTLFAFVVNGSLDPSLEKEISVENGNLLLPNVKVAEAPDLGNGTENLDAGNFAVIGSRKNVTFGVEVGGTQGNYNQVEESAKVGSIVWTISYDIANDGNIPTAPDKEPQETPAVPVP